MKYGKSTFSLTIVIVIMAVLAIFVGYLLGNWLIQMVMGDTSDAQQVMDNRIVEEEIIEDSAEEDEPSLKIKDEEISREKEVIDQIKGEVFVVQVGAFKNYENAVELKNKLASKGFQVLVTDNPPYKVQLGATTDRKEAEEKELEVEALGYNAFITH